MSARIPRASPKPRIFDDCGETGTNTVDHVRCSKYCSDLNRARGHVSWGDIYPGRLNRPNIGLG
eukprot:5205678-Pyramimonas_sp.AAC.1